jgi:hypothetical protein
MKFVETYDQYCTNKLATGEEPTLDDFEELQVLIKQLKSFKVNSFEEYLTRETLNGILITDIEKAKLDYLKLKEETNYEIVEF